MATSETGESQHRCVDAACNQADSSIDLRVDAEGGGLVIIGPTDRQLTNIEALLDAPNVEPIEALTDRLASWNTASAEAIEVGRDVSQAIRNGRTAVVYLDFHVGQGLPPLAEVLEFVCLRLGQLVIGVADVPAFVAIYGERMTSALLIDSLGERQLVEAGTAATGCPLWQLSSDTMFPGLAVAMCPGDSDATAMVELLDWFESRRS